TAASTTSKMVRVKWLRTQRHRTSSASHASTISGSTSVRSQRLGSPRGALGESITPPSSHEARPTVSARLARRRGDPWPRRRFGRESLLLSSERSSCNGRAEPARRVAHPACHGDGWRHDQWTCVALGSLTEHGGTPRDGYRDPYPNSETRRSRQQECCRPGPRRAPPALAEAALAGAQRRLYR